MTDQESWFPGNHWETLTPRQAGWNEQALEKALEQARDFLSTGVVMLKTGRIAVERYWSLPDLERYSPQLAAMGGQMMYGQDSQGHPLEDVASVQKSVTGMLAAIAVEKGLIDFDEPVSKYLGDQWAHVTRSQISAITLRHVMTMTSGLTESLDYDAPPGSKWRYNTGAYQNVLRVIEKATGIDANSVTKAWITDRIGMTDTRWVERAWANQSPPMMGLVTTPRDLARFGLLIMYRGDWNGEQIVSSASVDELTRPSQSLNPSYGMLFWLNSSKGFRTPASDAYTEGKRMPAAPEDMIAALGALNRFVFVLPTQQIVIVRTGLVDPTRPDVENFAKRWWENLAGAFNLSNQAL